VVATRVRKIEIFVLQRNIEKIMQDLKVQVTRKYRDYLIDSLKDSEDSAAYLTAILEEEDPDPEPELLRVALNDVAEALGKLSMTSQEVEQLKQSISLSLQSSQTIYELTSLI
jgi:DNA-binding phage protein